MDKSTEIKFSKFLCLLLRHQPEEIGLTLDAEGWADVDELLMKLKKTGKARSKDDLRQVVANNDKKRFIFDEEETKIRANQGHSIKSIDLKMQPVEPPEFLYHGTAERNQGVILESGIQKMQRQHVHLSKDKGTAMTVGTRHGKPLILTIATKQMFDDGVNFFLSENNVWLRACLKIKIIKFG